MGKVFMVRVTVSDARKDFSDTLNKVAFGGERIVLHRRDKDVVAIIPIADLQLLEQLEDAMDLDLVRKALAETRETMSWETLKEELDARSEIPD
jgi:prevent-host-death family protein